MATDRNGHTIATGEVYLIAGTVRRVDSDSVLVVIGDGTTSNEAIRVAAGDIVRVDDATGGGGVTDHGALSGLSDDDHPQYVLANGSRAFTGRPTVPVAPAPSVDGHVADKKYVLDQIGVGLIALGSVVQPLDALLTAIAALTTAANRLIYTTGVDTVALCDFTAAARTFVAATTVGDQRTALGLGDLAVQDMVDNNDWDGAGDPLDVPNGGTGATDAAGALVKLGAAAEVHDHAASEIVSGTIATARLGSGTADATKVLVGNQTWGAPPSHNHAASEITSGTVATARLGSGTANGTTFLRGDQTWSAPSDGWTYVKLTADLTVSTTGGTASDLTFTPDASSTYVIEGMFLLRSAATTTGAQVGIAWPSAGITDKASRVSSTNANTTEVLQLRGNSTTSFAASTKMATTTDSYSGHLQATLILDGSPSGSFTIQLASSTSGVNVKLMTGSWIRYRKI